MSDFITGSIVTLIAFILGLLGNMWYGSYQEKKKIRKEQLDKHFKEEIIATISILLKIIEGVKTNHGTIVAPDINRSKTMDDEPFPLSFGFENTHEYEAFTAHYPSIQQSWKEFIKKVWTHNLRVENRIDEIRQILENDKELPQIKKYEEKVAEKIFPEIPSLLFKGIYDLATGQRTVLDFSNAEIKDQFPCRYLILGAYNILVSESDEAIQIEDKVFGVNPRVETYKIKLADIQKSELLREKAIKLSEDCEQLIIELWDIKDKLELISKHGRNSFKSDKDCDICRNYIQ